MPALAVGLAVGCRTAAPTLGGALSLGPYQRGDGAITVGLDGETIDPYFAAKSLLAADAASADAGAAAAAWIEWLLPWQRPDGRFERLCRRDGAWVACAPADADDAMMALWIELLVRHAPEGGLPPRWEESLARADAQLRGLLDPATGVHVISRELPVALLMDNVEVYGALRAVAGHHERRLDGRAARAWRARADALAAAIERTFWTGDGFRVSTQAGAPAAGAPFYPDVVAQIFPLLTELPVPGGRAALYARWMADHRATWLDQERHDYPWGLVALVAARMGDGEAVRAWLERAAPFRGGARWNVLEEAIFAALAPATPTGGRP
jgi:hypothetical protein